MGDPQYLDAMGAEIDIASSERSSQFLKIHIGQGLPAMRADWLKFVFFL
jgi:hypothetical protein